MQKCPNIVLSNYVSPNYAQITTVSYKTGLATLILLISAPGVINDETSENMYCEYVLALKRSCSFRY
jgi:hypothetical protein